MILIHRIKHEACMIDNTHTVRTKVLVRMLQELHQSLNYDRIDNRGVARNLFWGYKFFWGV